MIGYFVCCILIMIDARAAQVRSQATTYTDQHKFTIYTKGMDFDGAKDYCLAQNSLLPKLETKSSKSAVANLIKGTGADYWIGATDRASEGNWKWLDGTNVNQSNWGLPDEPNNAGNNEHCAMIRPHAVWNDINCFGPAIHVICQQVISSPEEINTGIHRFIFYRHDSERVSFVTAANKCNQIGARLAEAHTSEIHEMIIKKSYLYFTDSGEQKYYWMGGNYIEQHHVWRWNSGGVNISYIPVVSNGEGDCVASSKHGWIGKECSENLPYICEKVTKLPKILNVSANSCNSSLIVTWSSSNGSVDGKYRIEIQSGGVIYRSKMTLNAAGPSLYVITNLSDSSLYDISITLCSDDCKPIYSHTVRNVLTGGRPDKISNVSLIRENGFNCVVKWNAPVIAVRNSIFGYLISISEELAHSGNAILNNLSRNWTVLTTEIPIWTLKGKPNRKYRFGIQAKTCAGAGKIVWSEKLCVTEMKGPDVIPTPRAESDLSEDGKVNFSVRIPDQTNGLISCLFVVVKMHSEGERQISNISLNNLKLMQVNQSMVGRTATAYIALAIEVPGQNEKETIVLLGDEKVTYCDVYDTYLTKKRRSQPTMSNGLLMGRNSRLDSKKTYEIFIISTTPSGDKAFFQSSKTLHLRYVNDEGSNIALIIVGVIGVLLIILFALVIVWKKKRTQYLRQQNNEDLGQTEAIPDKTMVYQNSAVLVSRNTQSDPENGMSDFEDVFKRMKSNDSAMFIDEFQKLTDEALANMGSTEIATKPELKKKNRYKNILPFDDTRVKLQNSDSGYINACYVDGFQQKGKFIATQGPLSHTAVDFWIMIVEHNCAVIVMLARCYEAAKMKCEKYWPDLGKTQKFGSVSVTNKEETKFCGFMRRTFLVESNLPKRENALHVCQYHFIKWPDHGIPLTTSHLIRMHKEVMAAHREAVDNSPIIVHCSAGAGRTGTFIGYDIVLDQSKKQRADVYQCVLKMRRQRVDMVQNCDQYILVHKLLLEHYLFGDTDLAAEETMKKFLDNDYRINVMAIQFENLSRVGRMETVVKKTKNGASQRNAMKVMLCKNEEEEQVLFADATFVESFDERLKMIALDGPKDATAENFWKVVLQYNVPVIVTLYAAQVGSKRLVKPWPIDVNTSEESHGVNITLRSENAAEHFKERILIVQERDNTAEVTQLQLLDRTDESTKAKQFISVIDRMQKLLRGHRWPVALIHCNDETGSAGSFCAVVNIIERLKVEHRVDVFRAVKDLRDCTAEAVKTLDEYIVCHQAVIDYLNSFKVYDNFR